MIEYLIGAGADVNVSSLFAFQLYTERFVQSKDKHGITAILAAIWEGHTDCVRLLLEKGASKDGTAPDGKSYLESAESGAIKQLLS